MQWRQRNHCQSKPVSLTFSFPSPSTLLKAPYYLSISVEPEQVHHGSISGECLDSRAALAPFITSKLEANFCFLTIWFLQDSSNDVRRPKIPIAGQRTPSGMWRKGVVCLFHLFFLVSIVVVLFSNILSKFPLFFHSPRILDWALCSVFHLVYETQINYFQGSTYAERRQIRCCYLSEVIKWWAEEIISRLSTKNDWPIFL